MKILSLSLRFIMAAILIQTLYFKFTANPESVYIFSQLKMEPEGRILSGLVELLASILLLTPKYFLFGNILSLWVIAGAILGHLTVLGIIVMDDGGLLFSLAVFIFLGSIVLITIHRKEYIELLKKISTRKNESLKK